MVDTMGGLREGEEAEAAVTLVTSNNQVCLKAALAVARLLRHARHVAARLQACEAANADLRAQTERAHDLVGSPMWHELCDLGDGAAVAAGTVAGQRGAWQCESPGVVFARGPAARLLHAVDGQEEGGGSCSGSDGQRDSANDEFIIPVEAVEQTVSGFLDAICNS